MDQVPITDSSNWIVDAILKVLVDFRSNENYYYHSRNSTVVYYVQPTQRNKNFFRDLFMTLVWVVLLATTKDAIIIRMISLGKVWSAKKY